MVLVRNPSGAGGSRTHTLQDRAAAVRNPGEAGGNGIKKTQTQTDYCSLQLAF